MRKIQPRRVDGVFRVPVDRAFGPRLTVVAAFPSADRRRGRSRCCRTTYPAGSSGSRSGARERRCWPASARRSTGHWDSHAIGRGDTVTLPGYFSGVPRCVQRPSLAHEKLHLKHGSELKFHTGTLRSTLWSMPWKTASCMAAGTT